MLRDEKEAEEVLQEGFSHIWHRAATYDPANGSAFAWAVMLLRQEAVDRLCLRKRQLRTQDELRQADGFAKGDEASVSDLPMREQRALVRSALANVSDEQRQAMELAFLSELTHEQIAAGLATSLRTFKARIRTGLLQLCAVSVVGTTSEEGRHDRAIEYLFGWMDAAAQGVFETELKEHEQLARTVAEFRECASSLAHAVPFHLPRAHLRGRVLEGIRIENIAPPPQSVRKARVNWVPWALAGALALCSGLLAADHIRLNANLLGWRRLCEQWREEATTRQREAAEASEVAKTLDERAVASQKQSTALAAELAQLKSRDVLTQITITPLVGRANSALKAAAIVLWDQPKQRGLIKLTNMPKAEAGKDFQLWANDPHLPEPVSAGVLPVGEDGSARMGFQTEEPVEAGVKFSISIEPVGGSATPTGPIVLAEP